MNNYFITAQVIVTLSIPYVWILRPANIVKEFKQFDLNALTCNAAGSAKIVLSTLLIAGIPYPAWKGIQPDIPAC